MAEFLSLRLLSAGVCRAHHIFKYNRTLQAALVAAFLFLF